MTPSDIFVRAFENLRTAVLLLDKSTGRVLEANPAFLTLCRRSRGEVVGRLFWAPPMIADAAAGNEVFEHLRACGRLEGAALPLETGAGSRVLVELNGGEISSGVVQVEVCDATSREGARVAERMEAQRSLAARVALELTGTDRVLQTAGQALANCARQGQSTFREADEIRRAGDRVGVVVKELLAYSGQLTLETCSLQLNESIPDMQPAIERVLGPDIQFVTHFSPEVAPVLADPLQLRQVVLRLAANSREAMEHGGKFHIRTGNPRAGDPAVGSETGGYAMLEVADEGPGLDDESWEHLFEPFRTTKLQGRRGLGLAAVHGTVRQMHGRLWAESEPGKGATFRIYLPRVQAEVAVAVAPVPLAQPMPLAEPATILLMEQNEGLRTVVANILRKRGYRVLAAGAANDALEMAKAEGPDLLISEPAPELVERLASLHPRARTLFLNGHSDRSGVPTLAKPFEVEALVGKVRELLAG